MGLAYTTSPGEVKCKSRTCAARIEALSRVAGEQLLPARQI